MRRLYHSSLALVLLAITACSSLANGSVLQAIDFMEPESFLEGAEFELFKEKKGCSLKGIGYGETGQNQYELYFDGSDLNKANYVSYRYGRPITEVKNDTDMFVVEKIDYGKNSREDAKFVGLFNQLKKLISSENLARCTHN